MSAADLRVFRHIEFEVLSHETLVPPKLARADERGTKFAAYYALLTRIATDYAAQTPSKMVDAEIERDYLMMRIKIFHKLDTGAIRNLPTESEQECARKLSLLESFARTLRPVPRL
jgi:hypothetical protein